MDPNHKKRIEDALKAKLAAEEAQKRSDRDREETARREQQAAQDFMWGVLAPALEEVKKELEGMLTLNTSRQPPSRATRAPLIQRIWCEKQLHADLTFEWIQGNKVQVRAINSHKQDTIPVGYSKDAIHKLVIDYFVLALQPATNIDLR